MVSKKAKDYFVETKRCYEGHKPLDFGGGRLVYGGSASNPAYEKADVYICLDNASSPFRRFPWEGATFVYYPVQDMHAPSNPDNFRKLVEWTAGEIRQGKVIHIGCIGGHGRTGTLLSALVKVILGVEDAITYVREHYCEKAVEVDSQVEFLKDHYCIKPVSSSRVPVIEHSYSDHSVSSWGYGKSFKTIGPGDIEYYGKSKGKGKSYSSLTSLSDYIPADDKVIMLEPAAHEGNIWGQEDLDKD